MCVNYFARRFAFLAAFKYGFTHLLFRHRMLLCDYLRLPYSASFSCEPITCE